MLASSMDTLDNSTSVSSPSPLAARMAYGLLVLGLVLMAAVVFIGGHQERLRVLGIPVLQPNFADVRTITGGADSVAAGYDPMVENPGDPWARPMNYPRIWQSLYDAGITADSAPLLAGCFMALFLAGCLALVSAIRTSGAVLWMVPAVFSPAVWLVLERGNNDMAVFGLLGLAVLLGSRVPWGSAAAIVLAAVLKLFPVFAIMGLMTPQKRTAMLRMGIPALLVTGYALFIGQDLLKIADGTPGMMGVSYGINILPAAIAKQVGVPSLQKLMLLTGLAVLALLAFGAFMLRSRMFLDDESNPAGVQAFRMGAALYAGTFLLGNNFDYRLIFLLFTMPMLQGWWKTATVPLLKKVLPCTLAIILLCLWSMLWSKGLGMLPAGKLLAFLLDEGLNWLLLVLLGGLLVLSLPEIVLPRRWQGVAKKMLA